MRGLPAKAAHEEARKAVRGRRALRAVHQAFGLAQPRPGSRVRLSVQDSGPGIVPALHDKLFEPFLQADSSTTRRFGGTGLGLTICRDLVRLMGGELQLDSTPDIGSDDVRSLLRGIVTIDNRMISVITLDNILPDSVAAAA